MSPIIIGCFGFCLLFLLMASGMYIGLAMGFAGFLGIWYLEGLSVSLATLAQTPFSFAADYGLMCVPLYILMGNFATESGMVGSAFKVARKWFGSLPGGLAVATGWTSAAFGAVSGSSSAAAATMATVCIPEMEKYGYSARVMTSSVAVGGTFAMIIPPSVALVVYGMMTEESIGKLYLAGFIPGILLAAAVSLAMLVIAKIDPKSAPPGPPTSIKEKVFSLYQMWEVMLVFIAVIGGIYVGVFTATEAAAVGVFITSISLLVKRKFIKANIASAISSTARVTVMIFVLLIGAMIFSNFIAFSGITTGMQEIVSGTGYSRYFILTLILLAFFIFGIVMDELAMMMLLIPIYYPIIKSLGFDGIWFGIIVVVMMLIGMLTPPLGITCFVVHGSFPKYPIGEIFRGVFPYVFVYLLVLAILVIFPEIVLFLPSRM
jgi:C4-dicarboxylate transporter, DctM subunit